MQRKSPEAMRAETAPSRLARWLIVFTLTASLFMAPGCGDDDSNSPADGMSSGDTSMASSGDTTMTSSSGDTSMASSSGDTTMASSSGDTTMTSSGDTSSSGMDMDMVDGMDMDMVDPPLVCETLPEPTSGRVCDVVLPTGGGAPTSLVLRGNILGADGIIEGGALVMEQGNENNRITCVGCDCTYDPATTTVVTCAEGVISPGLINGHDHTPYNLNAPVPPPGDTRYDHRHEWRRGSGSLNTGSPNNSRESVLHGEIRMLLGGATSIAGSVGSTDASGLLRNVDTRDYNEGLGDWRVDYSTFPLRDTDGAYHANCADYDIESTNVLNDRIYLPHIAEGINEEAQNEFRCLSSDADGGTDLLASNTSVVHGIGLTPADVAEMGAEGAKLVWSVRTNIQLYGNTASVPMFKNIGVTIAMGSDWSASGSMNMLRELQCADHLNSTYFNNTFTDRELWEMVTANGAVAMGADADLGVLAAGMIADIAIFDGAVNGGDYRAVIDGAVEDVVLTMRGGHPLYGDAALIEGLVPEGEQSQCEALTICTVDKRLCVERDAGITLSAIQSAVGSGAYDLFFCGAPDNEPSCVPLRSGEYDGNSSASDADGDGVDDSADNCPNIFNPPRPMDNGVQGDYDNDDIGDVCDPCPLNEGDTCVVFDPNDRDGDGVPNAQDNCPAVDNPPATPGGAQDDADSDGIGDACDACPDFSDVDGYCPASIYDIKQDLVLPGTLVVLEDVIVTGVDLDAAGTALDGVFVQVDPSSPAYVDENYSGVYIFMPAVTPTPAPGDIITVRGTVNDYFGQLQLSNVDGATGVVTASNGNALPTPVLVNDPADITATGSLFAQLEGVVVEVEAVSVTELNPPAGPGDSDPTNEFIITGGLKVDDDLFSYTLPAVNDTFPRLTGVLTWANQDAKLLPRDITDMGPPALQGFDPASIFLESGATMDVDVVLTAPAESNTTVTLAYPANVFGPSSTIIAAGNDRAMATLTGGAADAVVGVVTASYDGIDQTLNVRVYDSTEVRVIESFEPPTQSAQIGVDVMMTLTLDIPAEGDTVIGLGGTADLVLPAGDAVTVLDGERSVTFTVNSGTTVGLQTVTATLGGSVMTAGIDVNDAPMPGLIFSEYVEGSSFNKGVEVYNGSGADMDVSACEIRRYNNGGTSPVTYTMSGTLAAGDTFVVVHTQAAAAMKALADDESDDPTNFNGDDALELACNGTVIDSFGQVGTDPGTEWSGGGVTTVNSTLRRDCLLTAGDAVSDDAFDPSLEWETFASDTFDGLGEHCP